MPGPPDRNRHVWCFCKTCLAHTAWSLHSLSPAGPKETREQAKEVERFQRIAGIQERIPAFPLRARSVACGAHGFPGTSVDVRLSIRVETPGVKDAEHRQLR